MAITAVQLFSVPVSDQSRSRDWYVDVLGFELVSDTPMGPDARWVQVRPRGAYTSITLVTWFETMRPGDVSGIVIETDDLDGDVALLRSRGIDFPDGIIQEPWGRFVSLADPDGNGLLLQATDIAFMTGGASEA
ncbi:MAG: VOC family protein [Candidatus Nanopelagicales bacterium]|nr:VOC family protein [Candidatus Nanopelagicales bacterium]